jgi:hypothetical protein
MTYLIYGAGVIMAILFSGANANKALQFSGASARCLEAGLFRSGVKLLHTLGKCIGGVLRCKAT